MTEQKSIINGIRTMLVQQGTGFYNVDLVWGFGFDVRTGDIVPMPETEESNFWRSFPCTYTGILYEDGFSVKAPGHHITVPYDKVRKIKKMGLELPSNNRTIEKYVL